MASHQELSDFLESAEKRAFKRTMYKVRNEAAALDIVQEAMIKLTTNYADRPVRELAPLFFRILSNATFDYFRRQTRRNALFTNYGDFQPRDADGSFDILESLEVLEEQQHFESAETHMDRKAVLAIIEEELQQLTDRQRDAFLMRYWEEMSVEETAQAMGCSAGTIKTHCSRAVKALSKALMKRGISL